MSIREAALVHTTTEIFNLYKAYIIFYKYYKITVKKQEGHAQGWK